MCPRVNQSWAPQPISLTAKKRSAQGMILGFDLLSHHIGSTDAFFVLFCCYAATQLALQTQQERTQVVYSNREAWKRLA